MTRAIEPDMGKYAVAVTHASDDWYQIDGTQMYLQTSLCLSLALSEEGYLNLQLGGMGRLVFDDGDRCSVEGVYKKINLE